MLYREALNYLYAQLPMFQRVGPAAYKKDLGNTLALCAYLGNPHTKFKSVHIAGTNGKGSVSHMLAAACQTAGLKTGLYVSPHYKDFRERIKIDGQYISRKKVVDFVEKHRAKIEEIQPSFFELCVAMAFDHFAQEQVDIAIVEVGLGGRLDSTNIITPLLSVITNISYDHQNMLGDTLPLIAGEKAGIIKPGIPVVIGETHPESAPVFLKKAAETGSEIVFADQQFELTESSPPNWKTAHFSVLKQGQLYLEKLDVDAAGPFLQSNVTTALQAWEWLALPVRAGYMEGKGDQGLGNARLRQGFGGQAKLEIFQSGLKSLKSRTRFIGRWQLIGQKPTVLCDSAHNEAGLRTTLDAIKSAPFSRLHFVIGFVNDKSVDPVLALFPPTARYYFAKANIPRGLDATALREKAASLDLPGRAYSSVKSALQAAKRAATPEDLIIVTGSIFVVAEVLPAPE
ncbi:MAG: bifunctional folylpolyglutamate synthase/dihydrofolate synthase [Lewinellaceae bacterium]|nr:bifunctional folylpolyglutamate synthase/dihydrofolate synthase [Lewinellaceae bacterium]